MLFRSSFVSLLSSFALCSVFTQLMIFISCVSQYLFFCGGKSQVRQIYGVGSHICDFSRFVERLGYAHSLRYRETKFPRCLLLQGRCGKRRCGSTFALACLYFRYFEIGCAAEFQKRYCFRFLCEMLFEFCFETTVAVGKYCRYFIVRCRIECLYFTLFLDYKPYGNRLNPTSRESGFYFSPQHGR